MKKKSLKSILLLTTILSINLSLSACDDSSTETAASVTKTADGKVIAYSAPPPMPYIKTVSGNFLAGEHAQISNDWNSASDFFEGILQLDPSNFSIQNRVMALSLGAGDYDRAILLAKKVVKDNKEESLAQLILSLKEFQEGKFKEAKDRITSINKDGLGSAVVPLIQAWSDAGQGKPNYSILKDSPSFLYQNVLIADYVDDTATIEKLAKTYDFTKTATPISGLDKIADIFAKHGQKKVAKSIYTALKNAFPQQNSDFEEKLKKLDLDIKIDTAKVTPQEGLANALLDTARLLSNGYEESAILFTHMSSFLAPHQTDTLELLAQFSADNEQYLSAINYLTKINTDNDSEKAISVQRQIALLLQLDGQKEEAIRVLTDLAKNNNNVDAQIQIGDMYRQDEDFRNALAAYNKAADMLDNKIPQNHWELLFSRGIANERMEKWDAAEKDLQMALSFEPDQPYILNYLGYSWADQGKNLDKAAEMIEKAARLKPNDGAIIDSLGWVYYRTGQFEKAVKTLEIAIELQPYEPEINDHLGDAYWQIGRKQEARFQWKRAQSFIKNDDGMMSKIQTKIDHGLDKVQMAGK